MVIAFPKICNIGCGRLAGHHNYVRSIWMSYAKNRPSINQPKDCYIKIYNKIFLILPKK